MSQKIDEPPIDTKKRQNDLAFGPYRHLIWFSISYGFFSFFLMALASYEPSVFVIYPLVSIILASIILVAIWSVFGPGSYLKRLFWSHLTGLIVALGLGIGFLTFFLRQSGLDDRDLAFATAMILIGVPPLSLAAQLPFWFFRVFFGWQLVYDDHAPTQSYSLRDIFSVTFLFALSFAIPQLAINLQNNLYNRFDPSVEWVEVIQSDGSVTYREQKRTDETAIAAAQREHDTQIRLTTLSGFAGAAIYVFVITIFALPVLLFVFLNRENSHGCVAAAFYCLGLVLILLVLAWTIAGGQRLGETFLMACISIAFFGAAVSIPLSVSNATGFRLTSPKRYARQQLRLQDEAEIAKKQSAGFQSKD